MARIQSSKRELIPDYNIKGIQKIGRSDRRSKLFIHYLNRWADADKHKPKYAIKNRRTEFAEGYDQAVRDIMEHIEAETPTKKQ